METNVESTDFENLMRVKITQLEMIRDRNYDIGDEINILELDTTMLADRITFLNFYKKNAKDSKKRDPKTIAEFRHLLEKIYSREEDDGSIIYLSVFYPVREKGSRYINKNQIDVIFEPFMEKLEDEVISQFQVKKCSERKNWNEPVIESKPEAAGKGFINPDESSSKKKKGAKEGRITPKWILIISEVPLNSSAQKSISTFVSINIQLFLDLQLLYNPTKHREYLRHEAMTKREQEEFLTKVDRKILSQLPRLKYADNASRITDKEKKTDPIVSYFGFLPGQIIWIYRKNYLNENIIEEYRTPRVVYYH